MKALAFCFVFFTSIFSFGQKLELVYSTQSLIGKHEIYYHTHQNLPIFNKLIKKNTFSSKVHVFDTEIRLSPLNRNLLSSDTILNEKSGFLFDKGNLISVSAFTIMDTIGKSFTLYLNNQNYTIHHISHNSNLKDTLITGSVFLPDPLSSSGESYGGSFIDSNDETNDDIDKELKEVQLYATFEDGKFLLKNKHLKISNHSAPDIQPTERTEPIFEFNRSEIGFEEINALYHISRFADYIKDTLGFKNIVNYQIAVDVYALNGGDQSEFISSTNPPRLNFGQGGVDDAEDADVLIHEYSHAVSHSAAPGTLIGYERRAMDEGLADFWAAAYSKMLNEYNYKEIFNWDGHNEFWDGRSIDNQKKYTDGLTGNKYEDGELFGALLMDVRNNIEDSIADKIILQSIYSWYPNMNFSDAFDQIMKADTLMYNSENSEILHWVGCNRGVLTENCENIVEKNISKFNINYTLLNQGILELSHPTLNTSVKIFTLDGKLYFSKILNGKHIKLPDIKQGIYILQIDQFSEKIIIN